MKIARKSTLGFVRSKYRRARSFAGRHRTAIGVGAGLAGVGLAAYGLRRFSRSRPTIRTTRVRSTSPRKPSVGGSKSRGGRNYKIGSGVTGRKNKPGGGRPRKH